MMVHTKQESATLELLQGESKVNSAAWAPCCVQVTTLTSALTTYRQASQRVILTRTRGVNWRFQRLLHPQEERKKEQWCRGGWWRSCLENQCVMQWEERGIWKKKSSLLSCDDDHDDGGGGHYSQSEITGKQRIPSWQIAPHVWPLNTLLKCFTKRVLITLLSPSESQDWCTLPERVSHLHTGKQSVILDWSKYHKQSSSIQKVKEVCGRLQGRVLDG